MPHIKKTLSIFLLSAVLGGGAWYLNTTGTIGGVSSSVLNTSTFVCTEQSLKSYASTYRKTFTRQKKAIVIKKKLEKEIELLKTSDPNNQLQKKEETLKILVRQINTYMRFIKKYDTCKKEIKLSPTVSTGIMSGEAQVSVSQKEYQALAAFAISSPKGLNTYVQSIQFKAEILPYLGVVADKWFLLHEGANPIACQISADPKIIDCELSGDMPVDIMSGMSRTYGIAAHITALNGSGTVDIQITKLAFNDSRESAIRDIESPLLSFGVAAPVVEEPVIPSQVNRPTLQTGTRPEVTTTSETTSGNDVSAQEESTIDTTTTTTSSATTEETTVVTTETETPAEDNVTTEQEVTDTEATTVQDTSEESTSSGSETDVVDTTSGNSAEDSESTLSSESSTAETVLETSETSSETPASEPSEEIEPAPSSETL